MKHNEFDAKWNGHGFDMGSRKNSFKQIIEKTPNVPIRIIIMLPESKKMRKFYHGAVLRLWAYLDGANYKSWEVVHDYEEAAKLEFCPTVKQIGGKRYLMPGSTKGILPDVVEKVIEMLEEQYGIDRLMVLNPKDYKDFIDRVYTDGEYEDYIDYLRARKLLA